MDNINEMSQAAPGDFGYNDASVEAPAGKQTDIEASPASLRVDHEALEKPARTVHGFTVSPEITKMSIPS